MSKAKKKYQPQGTNMSEDIKKEVGDQGEVIKPVIGGDTAGDLPPVEDNDGKEEILEDDGDSIEEDKAVPIVVNQGTDDKSFNRLVEVVDFSKIPEVPVIFPVETTQQVAAKPTVADIVDTKIEVAAPTKYEAFIEDIRQNGTPSIKALLMRLESYVENMRPGKVNTNVVGANNQRVLWECIRGVVKHPDNTEFRKQWNLLLQFFNVHQEGSLGPRHVFRFAPQWSLGKETLDLKHVLINLIHLTADYTTREKGLKQVDLARTVQSKLLTEQERGRIKAFYNA